MLVVTLLALLTLTLAQTRSGAAIAAVKRVPQTRRAATIAGGVARCGHRQELPHAATKEEAVACLRDWRVNTNHSCNQRWWQAKHVGSSQGEDLTALHTLANSKTLKASVHSLWSSAETPRYFFEAGAYNGVEGSNTLIFERCLNWTGVLMEANPIHYQHMQTAGRANAYLFHGAPGCSKPGVINISSGGTEATTRMEFSGSRHHFTVPCFPLQPILSQLGFAHFDLFSLDVEGSEMDVLSTLDFKLTSAKLMLVEAYNRLCRNVCPKRDSVRTLLSAAGYIRSRSLVGHGNDMFTSPGLPGGRPAMG